MNILEKIYNSITINDIPKVFQYFTFWLMILLVIHKHVYKHIDILFLSVVVFVIGIYISHVNPKRYTLRLGNGDVIVDGWFKLATADVSHSLLLLYAIVMYGRYYIKQQSIIPLLVALAFLTTYFSISKPHLVYDVSVSEFTVLMTSVTLFYIVFLLIARSK